MARKSDHHPHTADVTVLRATIRERVASVRSGDHAPESLTALASDLEALHDILESQSDALRGTLVMLADDMTQVNRQLNVTGDRLATVLDAAHDVAFIISAGDDNGTILEFSAGASAIFGYSRDRALGLPVSALGEPPRPGATGAATCLMEDCRNYRVFLRRKNGEPFPAIVSTYPLRPDEDGVTPTLLLIRDNSEREQARQELQESVSRFEGMAMITPVSILAFDGQGAMTFVNTWHMQRIEQSDESPEQYLGQRIDTVPAIVRAGVGHQILGVLDGNHLEFDAIHLPQTDRLGEAWLSIRTSPFLVDGTVTGGVLIIEDITQRKKTELDLKQLIDSSPIPILRVERTEAGRMVRSLNPEAMHMLGSDVLGQPMETFVTPVQDDRETLEGLRGEQCEVTGKDAAYHVIRTVHNQDDRFEVHALMDVGALLHAKEAAEEAHRIKADFIANMSHEIRTPLNGLLGVLDLLGEHDMGEEINELLAHADASAQVLLSLLNDILDFSLIEARGLHLHVEPFDPSAIIETMALPYRMESERKGLVMTTEIGAGMPALLRGDVKRLRQILFHLISNGVKFTEQGRVDIAADHVRDATDGIRFVLWISDTGIGMTDQQVAHVFDLFRQADGSRTRKYGGTGIGMALVSGFVRAMGGDIHLSSEPGTGTDVIISLPLEEEHTT